MERHRNSEDNSMASLTPDGQLFQYLTATFDLSTCILFVVTVQLFWPSFISSFRISLWISGIYTWKYLQPPCQSWTRAWLNSFVILWNSSVYRKERKHKGGTVSNNVQCVSVYYYFSGDFSLSQQKCNHFGELN